MIGRLLTSLERDAAASEIEVVVVANGCTDDTVSVASAYTDAIPWLRIVETGVASKRRALQIGDDVASTYPRIFVDADIEFSENAVRHLVNALDNDRPLVGAPSILFDDEGASRAVKAFYRAFRHLPYASSGLVGLGVYGLSRSGRQRFDSFPDVTADDLFVQQLFAEDERVVTPGHFIVRTPRRLSALISVRTRVAAGNRELAAQPGDALRTPVGRTSRSTLRGLVNSVLTDARSIPDVVVYVVVTVISRVRARRFAASVWHRDETSR